MVNFIYNIIIFPLTQIIEFSFVFSQKIFKETGISLVFVSLVISVLCLPLYTIAEEWQEKERFLQKKMKPKIDRIRAVFTGDERYMITSAYYRQNHYHPVFALRSSFSLLIQIPFFIAAYAYLSNLEALKGAQFLFIRDLGLPDALGHLGEMRLNVFPILMTFLNLAAGAVYTKGFPLKDKLQLAAMSFIFLVLLYNSPSGLVIYWTMNNLFSLVKNIYYKIRFSHKNTVLFAVISAVCIFLIYYILAIHKGDRGQRLFIAVSAGLAALFPWVLRFIARSTILSKTGISASVLYRENGDLNHVLPQRDSTTFYIFLFSFLTLCLLTGIFIPGMLIVSSPEEFSYIDNYTTPLFFIFNAFSQSLGFFVLWPIALYFLLSPKIKYTFAGLGFFLCIAAILNTFVFPGNYGLISINMQLSGGVGHSSRLILFNIFVMCIFALLSFLLFHFHFQKILTSILSICLAALLGISLVNIFRINRIFSGLDYSHIKNQEENSSRPFFSLSRKGKNTVIIMLDRASSSFFPYILEESPDLKKIYSGFTYYPNTVSFNGYTMVGAPPIFGGYEYTPQEINKRGETPLRVKHNEALLLLPRLFSAAGYSVTVTDPPYPNYSKNNDFSIYDNYPEVRVYRTDGLYTNLWVKEHNLKLPSISAILKRNIFWYGLFRISPPTIRRGLYQYGDWCSSIPGQKLSVFLNGYTVLDYLPRLGEITDNEENTLLLMVNNTTHDGAFLQEPDYLPVLSVSSYFPGPYNKETEYHINIAAYKRLGKWFDFLKTKGVYDNTRIILVSDHGSQINYVMKPFPSMPSNIDNFHPILLVKDFGASGELKTDMVFMTNADVPFLALTGQVENLMNPFTGNAISTANKEKPLYIAVSGSVHLEDPLQTRLSLNPNRDYYVNGGMLEEKNWSKVEE
jgi:YidC/Oxa1 family membrane protein insertase